MTKELKLRVQCLLSEPFQIVIIANHDLLKGNQKQLKELGEKFSVGYGPL